MPPPYRPTPAGSPGGDRAQPRPAAAANGAARPTAPQGERPLFSRSPAGGAPPTPSSSRPEHPWHPGGEPDQGDAVASIRLSGVLDRLDPHSVRDARPALVPLARALEPDEEVLAIVQGWVKGLLCLVVRTPSRILVVVDRFPEPLVESLDPVTTKVVPFGPPGTDRISVSVVDGNRLLEVVGVRDRAQADALARVAGGRRPRQPATSGYF